METMELAHFGWNLITFTLILAFFCTLTEGIGFFLQSSAIWKKKSGESVSVTLFVYLTCMYAVIAYYGMCVRSLALMVDGSLLCLSCIPIVVGLWKFKGFSSREKGLAALCLAGPLLIILSPRKDVAYLLFCACNVIPNLVQTWEIRQGKTSGNLSIGLLWTVFCTVSVWSVYGFVFGDWSMMVVFPLILVSIIITIVTWYRYHVPDATPT
jgi:uncharacterized protein with PQ loop repeat